jgi:hypothetical protein
MPKTMRFDLYSKGAQELATLFDEPSHDTPSTCVLNSLTLC